MLESGYKGIGILAQWAMTWATGNGGESRARREASAACSAPWAACGVGAHACAGGWL